MARQPKPATGLLCPDCGERAVAERSAGHWHCSECAFEFSGTAPPTSRTVDQWLALLPELIPAPVTQEGMGEFHGGDGPALIVSVDPAGIHVSGAKIAWDGQFPYTMRVATRVLPLDTAAATVAQAITRVWARELGKQSWCVRCHRRFPKGHMWSKVCHGCATRHLHVIF